MLGDHFWRDEQFLCDCPSNLDGWSTLEVLRDKLKVLSCLSTVVIVLNVPTKFSCNAKFGP